ncbi:hypothetical protein RJT34_24635 [Clitoria ternatea]|uniref:Uncharacterized protein n=1 Tax=Clitoria ternatea TaxID=43366 RepID=A0AAN9FN93_CLITE
MVRSCKEPLCRIPSIEVFDLGAHGSTNLRKKHYFDIQIISLQGYYHATSHELTRLDSITTTPVIHHSFESLAKANNSSDSNTKTVSSKLWSLPPKTIYCVMFQSHSHPCVLLVPSSSLYIYIFSHVTLANYSPSSSLIQHPHPILGSYLASH